MGNGKEIKNIVIIGAGTGGTMVANRLARLVQDDVRITVIEPSAWHFFQPGLLSLPFGRYQLEQLRRPVRALLSKKVNLVQATVSRVDVAHKQIYLGDQRVVLYDILVIASGCQAAAAEIPGMTAEAWRNTIHDFYSPDGAQALAKKLESWTGGNLVMHINEMPIKCPVAPLEFCFLADDWLRKRGKRRQTKLIFVTPLSGAFTKPQASQLLGRLLRQRDIEVVPDFGLERVDCAARELVGYDDRRVAYDLLVTVPTNKGADFISESGLGDELNFIPTDPHTLQAKGQTDIFVIGDAASVPTSKAGSVAHFEAETVVNNIRRALSGGELDPSFDGHANCFLETGAGKALLLDFNYTTEPSIGKFPWPVIGPFSLLKESRINYWGKRMFRWVYWPILLHGYRLWGLTNKVRTSV